MNKNTDKHSGNENKGKQAEKKSYRAPHLIDYGVVSELTNTSPVGPDGDDGGVGPSSYTAS